MERRDETEGHVVEVRGGSIRLGQLLKLADAVDQGGDVKGLLASGLVSVNGVAEPRRGRQLAPGDAVTVGPTTYLLKFSTGLEEE